MALYEYQPTLVGAGILSSIFCVLTAFHGWQLVRNRTWHMVGFVTGGVRGLSPIHLSKNSKLCLIDSSSSVELVSYAARAASATQKKDRWSMEPYLIQSTFLLVAPTFFATSIYSTFGRIIAVTDGDAYALIKKRWVAIFFVLADVFALLMQAVGGGLMAMGSTDPTRFNLGQHTIVGGLIVQLVVYCLFFVSVATFYRRLSTLPSAKRQKHARIDWHRHLTTLFVVSILLMVRSLFRILEYAQGHDGYLYRHEAFTYVFDALPMALTMAYTSWTYPVLRRKERGGIQRFHLARVSGGAASPREIGSPARETA
ncbi:rta1 domain protein [Diplodia corticola]|uniref:Rta1 domain protein n=1 Tax=Diplodia corticola TaxID=236234 RepID=A0A1J9QZ93_9PEZI|nr:rta1 domain protein [Diplodia corticola]OJD33697.1 rta1 domain protein [Diplodia corticola]